MTEPLKEIGQKELVVSATHATRLKEFRCKTCGYLMDACSPSEQGVNPPEVGDYAFCMNCAAVLLFNSDMSLRHATEEDLIAEDPDFVLYIFKMQRDIRRGMAIIKRMEN